jgi:hypothetical protein
LLSGGNCVTSFSNPRKKIKRGTKKIPCGQYKSRAAALLTVLKSIIHVWIFKLTLSREALGPIGPSVFKGLQLKA